MVLFLVRDFPQPRNLPVTPGFLLGRPKYCCHGFAPARNGDRAPMLLNLEEQSNALRLELGRAHNSILHRYDDSNKVI